MTPLSAMIRDCLGKLDQTRQRSKDCEKAMEEGLTNGDSAREDSTVKEVKLRMDTEEKPGKDVNVLTS